MLAASSRRKATGPGESENGKKGGSPVGERELTVEYKGESDPDLDAALGAVLKPFGYELRDKGYDQHTRVRDLRFLKEG